MTAAYFEDHPTDPEKMIMRKPRLDQGPDYERGFVDGMQYQMHSSVDKAVNRMAQPERHELQAKGEHPAPCARHCEATAFRIVIKNLESKLAQPEQEPVAWIYDPITERIITPQRNPLSDEEALEIARTFGAQPWPPGSCVAFARAIEAAHGIKE